jgi:WD40 repeat protein
MTLGCIGGLCLAGLTASAADVATQKPIAITRPHRSEPIDFHREVVPILQANCLPCHNRTTTKADLRLETPEEMRQGGESGPALIPGQASESRLLQLSAHEAKPRMPPKDNKVHAVDLTPAQLGILALWIEQGAKASEKPAETIRWQPVAPEFQASYAVALSADGQFAACGRGNRLFIYHVPTRTLVAELSDPAVPGAPLAPAAAHLDVVNALAFNPTDDTLASGGFREVKLWRRSVPPPLAPAAPTAWPPPSLRSDDGRRRLLLTTNGLVSLLNAEGATVAELHSNARLLAPGKAQTNVARQRLDAAQRALESARKESSTQQERLKKALAAEPGTAKNAIEKRVPFDQSRREVSRLEGQLAHLARLRFPPTHSAALQAALVQKLAAARQAGVGPENDFTKAERNRSQAENETALARISFQNATTAQLVAEARLRVCETELRLIETRWSELRGNTLFSPFTAGALAAEGRLAATAERSGWLRLWEADTGRELAATRTELTHVTHLQFSGPAELRAGHAGAAVTWKFIPAWHLTTRLGTGGGDSPLVDRVNALAFSPDGTRLASGSGEPTRGSEIRVWDTRTGAPVYAVTNRHSDAVLALAFSPDGRFLASGGADRFARVLETGSGRPVRAFEGHTGHILTVAWKADGEVLATGGADSVVKLWQWPQGERLRNVEGFGQEVTGAQFLGPGEQWVAASGAAKIRLLNLKGEEAGTLPAGNFFAQALAASADGSVVAAGGDDGCLRVWTVKDRRLIGEFPQPHRGANAR